MSEARVSLLAVASKLAETGAWPYIEALAGGVSRLLLPSRSEDTPWPRS